MWTTLTPMTIGGVVAAHSLLQSCPFARTLESQIGGCIGVDLARDLERRRANMLNINPDKPFIEQSSTAEISSSIAGFQKP